MRFFVVTYYLFDSSNDSSVTVVQNMLFPNLIPIFAYICGVSVSLFISNLLSSYLLYIVLMMRSNTKYCINGSLSPIYVFCLESAEIRIISLWPSIFMIAGLNGLKPPVNWPYLTKPWHTNFTLSWWNQPSGKTTPSAKYSFYSWLRLQCVDWANWYLLLNFTTSCAFAFKCVCF